MPGYNNYFPVNYQQMYPYQQPTMQPQTQQNNGIVWVQGEAGAKSYLVAPGQSMLLMDSESEQFFIKTSDTSGMPMPLRTFKYKEITGVTENASKSSFNPSLYVTKEELESRLNSLKMTSKKGKADE